MAGFIFRVVVSRRVEAVAPLFIRYSALIYLAASFWFKSSAKMGHIRASCATDYLHRGHFWPIDDPLMWHRVLIPLGQQINDNSQFVDSKA